MISSLADYSNSLSKSCDMKSRQLLAVTALLVYAVDGQTDGVLETCGQTKDDSARIACLEGAVTALEAQLSRPPAPVPSAPVPTGDLGAEQVPGKSKETIREQRIQAKVSALRFNGYHKLTVMLDNGQTWQQLDGDTSNLRGRIDDADDVVVDIKRSRFGGYRMLLTPPDKILRVRRLE
jgi:hypothetical protein